MKRQLYSSALVMVIISVVFFKTILFHIALGNKVHITATRKGFWLP